MIKVRIVDKDSHFVVVVVQSQYPDNIFRFTVTSFYIMYDIFHLFFWTGFNQFTSR